MELKSLDSTLTTPPKETETETEKDKDERSLLKSSSASYAPETLVDELDKKYAPYARKDAFGPMGRGPVPFSQRVLVALAALTLLPLRFISGVLILFLYFLICRLCTLTLFSNPNHQNVNEQQQEDHLLRMTGWRRHAVVQAGRLCARAMLFVFGFYWILIEDRTHHQLDSPGPGAIVSNHVSYVDILYHMSSSFPSFVAKASVAKLPLVGLISKCLACIYVQRESKSTHSKGVSGAVTDRVQQAHQNKNSPMMLLFPEGTTTNGDYLLPFKSGAFLAKAPVVPIILRYPYKRFSPAWDSMSGMRHLFLLLCQFVNYIEVIKLPVYYPSEEEKEDPRLYANNVRKLMATEGNLILSEIGLSEKRVYHAALNGYLSQR